MRRQGVAGLPAFADQAEAETLPQYKAPAQPQRAGAAGPLHAAVRREYSVTVRHVQPVTHLRRDALLRGAIMLRGDARRGLPPPQRLGAAVGHAPARIKAQGQPPSQTPRVQGQAAAQSPLLIAAVIVGQQRPRLRLDA